MPEQIVEMEEILCSTNSSTILITRGITTCIAFALNGSYFDEDDNLIEFCALFHWPGFNNEQDPEGKIETVLETFLEDVRVHLKLSDEEEIIINRLVFIGGERKQYNEHNEVLLSGTETEVETLIKIIKTFDFEEYSYVLNAQPEHWHFLTKDNDSIEVKVTLRECFFEIEKDAIEPSSQPLSPKC